MPRAQHAFLLLMLGSGCSHPKPEPPAPDPAPEPPPPVIRTIVDTVVVRDSSSERQVRILEGRLRERDAQIEALEGRLDTAQQDVARLLASSQGNRAEATSAIAEAEVAIRSSRGIPAADVSAARRNLKKATEAFSDSNYAGAIYYANQAKTRVQSTRRTDRATPPARPRPRTSTP